MIYGVGLDFVDMRRIGRVLKRFPTKFLERIFSEAERRVETSRATNPAHWGKRWAAKEACAKALGTGFKKGVGFHQIEIFSDPSGQPRLVLAPEICAAYFGGKMPLIHLSLSDEYPYAGAVVVIENRDI